MTTLHGSSVAIDGLVDKIAAAGVQLWFEGSRLRFRGPPGALTSAQRELLARERAAVLAELRRRAAARVQRAPLSSAQALVWHDLRDGVQWPLHAFAAQSAIALDASALQQALQALVDRHDALRMRIESANGAPVQRIEGAAIAQLHRMDATGLDAPAMQRLEAEAARPLDLAVAPLRLLLLVPDAGPQAMLFLAHPIATDAASFQQLVDELRQFYAEASGAPCKLPGRIEAGFVESLPVPPAQSAMPALGALADRWKSLWPRTDLAEPLAPAVWLPGVRAGRFANTVGPFAACVALDDAVKGAGARILQPWSACSLEPRRAVATDVERFLHGDDPLRTLDFGTLELGPLALRLPGPSAGLRLRVSLDGATAESRWIGERGANAPEALARLADDFRDRVAVGVGGDAREVAVPAQGGDSAPELVERLEKKGVHLWLEEDRLRVNAPKGVLDEAVKAELTRHKAAVLELLRSRTGGEPAIVVDRSTDLPLWHTQQRLWFLKQMDPGNTAYQIGWAFRMEGTLDEAAMERCLADLVQRHESLRTRFVVVDGTPRCVIEPAAQLLLEHIDFDSVASQEREAAAERALRQFIYTPFDITRAPLTRVALMRLAPRSHLFCFVQDHMISDGLSMAILLVELRALYTQHVGGPPAALPPLKAQYVDVVERMRRALKAGGLDRHVDYWKRQLAGMPPALQLPADRPRPPVQTYRGARRGTQYPVALTTQLRGLARAEGATLFMVLLAAFQALLHRYTGVDDIPVGTAVANRSGTAAEGVVGFFANNIVLRGDLAGRPTVRELLARVRETCLQGMSHAEVPFEMLVEALGTRREIDHAPLFQVMFVLHGVPMRRLELPGLACEVVELGSDAARFDVSVDMFDTPDGLHSYFEYNTDLFDPPTIERMMDQFRTLLEAFAAQPDARVDELRMLGADEERRMLVDWNATALDYPRAQTVHGLFEKQVRRTPDAVALRFEQRELTYRELNARANQLAHHLHERGVGAESCVGVWMERGADMVVALLGVLKAGAAYVPLDPAFPAERIEFMMADAELAVVVTQSALAATLGPGSPGPVCVDGDAVDIARHAETDPAPLAGGNNLAYIIYTSGSTGRPKGVQIEHRSVVNFLLSMHREPGIGPQDRVISVTTLSFDIAGLEIHGPLTAGGAVVIVPRATTLDGVRLAKLIEHRAATVLQATPATWRLLLESGWRGRPGLKMLCGGEALQRDLAERLLALGGELWNLYGPTETTIWSTITRVTDATRMIPIGRPIANTEVFVLEPSGQPAPIGVGGELCIGGAGLARGYRNRDELTAEKFVTVELPGIGARRVYRTGDVVRFLPSGLLEYVGRRDQQVKVRGFRIELGEIEAVLSTHPGIRECVVQVREDTPGDQRLVAYLVPQADVAFDADAARSTLRAKLPEYMIPNIFVTLEALPLTPNGKIDRKALPAPQVQAVASAAISEAVMTPTQRQVASIWRHVLGIERVGLDANFFDIGGHSLLLVRLQAALQREFGRELPLVELFQRTTVAAQAERLGAPKASDTAMKRAQARAAKQHHE